MKRRSVPWRAAATPARGALSLAMAGVAAVLSHGAARAADACSAQSPRQVASVVELYTSEGCSSCPPADRWLSALKADPAVIALAFHVDYWDRLGWKDRFASAAFTARQSAQQASNGARFSYTPQVVVDGRDRPDWPRITVSSATAPTATVGIGLTRRGDGFAATVTPAAGAPQRLAAYWAVTEQGHRTAVKAGENDGAMLQHDFVVRDYVAVPAWSARAGATESLSFRPATTPAAAHPRSVNLVVVDAATGRPVQAAKVSC